MTPNELRSRRVAIGITVGELAFEVRLPIRAVRDIESDSREVPNADLFLRTLERLERGYVVRRTTTTSDS
jgi:transcriptional regulator with XRE-family HTH domain